MPMSQRLFLRGILFYSSFVLMSAVRKVQRRGGGVGGEGWRVGRDYDTGYLIATRRRTCLSPGRRRESLALSL